MAKSLTAYPYRDPYRGQGGTIVPREAMEIVDPRIADVEALARWLDYAFVLPGGFRFGVAGIVGLIPGIGDIFDAVISLYIVGRAIQLQLPRVAVARMTVNVGIEAVAGAVPFIGDLFDIAFKANLRNYRILKNHIAEPHRQKGRDWFFLIALAIFLILIVSLPVVGLVELIRYL
ncbi:MAG: DUF4112 domain-containing protein [Acidobacteriota bacterium]|nr:DUF4112 domain-containing protein [Acidobacteriota bacterium]